MVPVTTVTLNGKRGGGVTNYRIFPFEGQFLKIHRGKNNLDTSQY